MRDVLKKNHIFFKFVKNNKIEIGLIFLTILIFYSYGLNKFPILQDHGIFSLMTQELLRGYPPYTTITSIKTPMIFFLNALGIAILNLLPDYFAIRIVGLFIGSLVIVVFYKNLKILLKDKSLAFIACLVLMSFTFLAEVTVIGSPKVLMIFFWLTSCFFLFKHRFLLSGIAAGLSFLSWQPGGLIILAPMIFIVLENKKMLKRSLKVILGFCLPLIVISIYYLLVNSFSYLLEFTILFPIKYKKTVFLGGNYLFKIFDLIGYFCSEFFFLVLGLIGLVMTVYIGFRSVRGQGFNFFRKKKYLTSFFLPYLLFSLYILGEFETGYDFVPLLPFVSLLVALVFKKIIEMSSRKEMKEILTMGIIIVISIYGFFPVFQPVYPENPIISEGKKLRKNGLSPSEMVSKLTQKHGFIKTMTLLLFRRKGEQITIDQQLEIARIIQNGTSKNDKILSLGSPQIIFLSGRRSLNRYPLLSRSTMQHMLKNVGLENFYENVEREKPKFIIAKGWNRIDVLGLRKNIENNYKEVKIPTQEHILFKRK